MKSSEESNNIKRGSHEPLQTNGLRVLVPQGCCRWPRRGASSHQSRSLMNIFFSRRASKETLQRAASTGLSGWSCTLVGIVLPHASMASRKERISWKVASLVRVRVSVRVS